jgi:hypothetical protein
MLRAVSTVSKEIFSRCGHTRADLDLITQTFCDLTVVDQVHFVEYDTPADNPLWGGFQRWSKQPGVYTAFETIVEIRYAKHLTEEWRRFVVCKELCHALDTSDGCHVVTPAAVDNLVNTFALTSTAAVPKTTGSAYQAEVLAEVGALVLMCPLEARKVAVNGVPFDELDVDALCTRFGIPKSYANLAFGDQWSGVIELLMQLPA